MRDDSCRRGIEGASFHVKDLKRYFDKLSHNYAATSVTRKKSPNVYKSCPINDICRKMIDFDTFTNLPKNVGDLGK